MATILTTRAAQLIPTIPNVVDNQQVLYQLAQGTGGFVIVNSNDLLGGMQKIAREQTEYYVLGYAPASVGGREPATR